MLREHAKVIDNLSQIVDLAMITVAFILGLELYRKKGSFDHAIDISYFIIYVVYTLIWLLVANASSLYASRRLSTPMQEFLLLFRNHVFASFGSLAILPLLIRGLIHDRFIYYFITFALVLTAMVHISTRVFLHYIRRSGRNTRYILLLGQGHATEKIVESFRNHLELGYIIVGYVAHHRIDTSIDYFGDYNQLEQALSKNVVDVVIVTDSIHDQQVRERLDLIHMMGKTVVAAMDEDIYRLTRLRPFQLAGLSMVAMYSRPAREWQSLFKQMMDIMFSAVGLILASPLILAIALGIKMTSKGPVLFAQNRVGFNGRIFKMYKFRSMVTNAEELRDRLAHLNEMSGPVFKIKDDPRVTPIGRFLRKTSLDELPQLWNVFRQEMSLVGPRPPLPNEVNLYDPKHRKRLSVKPGLTCIWQVSGRNDVDFDQWMEMDAEYVDNWSLVLDMKILAKTVPVVLGRKGAS